MSGVKQFDFLTQFMHFKLSRSSSFSFTQSFSVHTFCFCLQNHSWQSSSSLQYSAKPKEMRNNYNVFLQIAV